MTRKKKDDGGKAFLAGFEKNGPIVAPLPGPYPKWEPPPSLSSKIRKVCEELKMIADELDALEDFSRDYE